MQKRGFHRFSRTHLTFFWAGHHHFDLASQVLVSTDEGILDVQHSGRIGQTVSPSLYLFMSRNAIYVEATNPADNQIEKQIKIWLWDGQHCARIGVTGFCQQFVQTSNSVHKLAMLQNLMQIINHILEVQFSRLNTTQINLHHCIWHSDNMIIITINLCAEVHLSAQMLWITCQVWGKSWRILFAHVTYCWLEQSFIFAFCCFKSHFAFSLRRGVSETKNIPVRPKWNKIQVEKYWCIF